MKAPATILFFFAFLGSGCATIVEGSTRTLRLHTSPDYATAVVNGEKEYGANSTIELDGMGPYVIELKKDGYYSQKITIEPELNGWFFLNLALGPLFPFGMVVDALTGAVHSLPEPDLRVALIQVP